MHAKSILLVLVTWTAAAQGQEPALAIRLEVNAKNKADGRINVFLENLTNAPIKLNDQYSPCFQSEHWLDVKVDGQRVSLSTAYCYTLGNETREIAARGRFALGELRTGEYSDENPLPFLKLQPGERTVEVAISPLAARHNKLGDVRPAAIKITMPAK